MKELLQRVGGFLVLGFFSGWILSILWGLFYLFMGLSWWLVYWVTESTPDMQTRIVLDNWVTWDGFWFWMRTGLRFSLLIALLAVLIGPWLGNPLRPDR